MEIGSHENEDEACSDFYGFRIISDEIALHSAKPDLQFFGGLVATTMIIMMVVMKRKSDC